MITVLAASLMAVPQVTTRTARNILQAYPTRAMQEGKSGAVRVRVWIDTLGQVYRCQPLQLVGDTVFQQAVCEDRRRWRLGVAKTADGKPAYGVLTTLVRYSLNGEAGRRIQALREPADITLRVSSDARQSYPDMRVAVEVRSDGTISHCEGMTRGASDALTERACAAALQQSRPIATDAAGSPVPYVEALLVRVESSSAS